MYSSYTSFFKKLRIRNFSCSLVSRGGARDQRLNPGFSSRDEFFLVTSTSSGQLDKEQKNPGTKHSKSRNVPWHQVPSRGFSMKLWIRNFEVSQCWEVPSSAVQLSNFFGTPIPTLRIKVEFFECSTRTDASRFEALNSKMGLKSEIWFEFGSDSARIFGSMIRQHWLPTHVHVTVNW